MFKSHLAQMIEQAVEDCITYGSAQISSTDRTVKITAEWSENETDIEVNILENGIIRFTFTEAID